MDDLLRRLPSREILAATGFCLIMFGLILRGLVRTHRRTLAMRRQHEIDVRRSGDTPAKPTHFDRYFPIYANVVWLLGVFAVGMAILRPG